MIGWLLGLSLLMGCEQEPESARSLIAKTPARVMYQRARTAMADEGISHLVWGATPFVSDSASVAEQFQPTVDLVSQRIGVPMSVRAGDNYAHVEQMLLAGDIDIAIMSPYAYVQAKAKEPKIRVFSSPISNGTESYGAYILTTEDSPIQTLADLRGKPFAFVSSRSTSGWLYPASRLLDEGINPTKDIKGMFYRNHGRVIAAIASGEVAAGATYDSALVQGRGEISGARDLRVIARTRRIPRDAYVVRAGFPSEALLGLSKALSSVSNRTPEGRSALTPLQDINGFIRADDSMYKPVREIEDKVQSLLGVDGGTLPSPVPEEEESTREQDPTAPQSGQ